MSEQQSLLKAIVENPTDVSRRLVYADWLEENGQTERAELIRLQCEFEERNDPPPHAYCPTRQKSVERHYTVPHELWQVEKRIRELLGNEKHEDEWLGGLRKVFFRHKWRCGFPEVIKVTAKKFLANANKILSTIPLTRLELYLLQRTKPPTRVSALLEVDGIENMAGLDLSKNQLGKEGIEDLVEAAPRLKNLETLWWNENELDHKSLEALLASPDFGKVKTLWLMGNELPGKSLGAFAKAKHWKCLEAIWFGDNHVNEKGMEEFVSFPHRKQLKHLHLGGCPLSTKSVETLISMSMPKLEYLGLAHSITTEKSLQMLVNSPFVKSLKVLDVSHTDLSPGSIKALTDSPYLENIEWLQVDHADIDYNLSTGENLQRRFGSRLKHTPPTYYDSWWE